MGNFLGEKPRYENLVLWVDFGSWMVSRGPW
jgi:hypothetical protein